jgi:hypothetical protein
MIKRMTISLGTLGLVLGTSAAIAAGPATAAAPQAVAHLANPAAFFKPGGVMKPATARPESAKSVGGRTIQYSSNWSGYAVTGSTYTSVSANWTQSKVSCSSSDTDTDMSPWVGIDGYSSSTVEQTGTSGDCNGSSVDYYAWYEMYPANYVTINKTVKPGDEFTGTVTHTSGSTSYTLKLADDTEGWTYSVTKKLSASDDSAEAILEMAADELSTFSTVPFTDFTVNGTAAGAYPSSDIQQMEIEDGSTICDTTSSLSSEENFTNTWENLC